MGKDSLKDQGSAQFHFQKLGECLAILLHPPKTEPSVGGGLFVFGEWPAGGVVSDASQAGDQKRLGVGCRRKGDPLDSIRD